MRLAHLAPEPNARVSLVGSCGNNTRRRLLSFRVHGMRPVQTSDFEFLRVLGEGGFGKVFAVAKKDTRCVSAFSVLVVVR